jgi:23S rRNA (uracil1939-C5)-methyltransferase
VDNNKQLDVDIVGADARGDGIAIIGRRTIAVPFTIPGERVRVAVDDRTGRASLLSVLAPSPHRVLPRCPHFGPCGGCAWQHIAYPEQLRLKTALVERLLRETVPRAPAVLPALAPVAPPDGSARQPPATHGTPAPRLDPDAPWAYRQKVHFVFATTDASGRPALSSGRTRARGGGRLVMGHYARGSRRVVPVRECPVHDARGNTVAFGLHAALASAHVHAADPAGADASRNPRRAVGSGVLRSVAIRVALHTGELMTTLVVTDDGDKGLRTATRKAFARGTLPSSLHLNLHPRQDAFIFGRETRHISGAARLRDTVAGTSFLISPTAFFQTNVQAAELLVRLVREAVPAGAAVLDLYAGAGLFALPLAAAGHRVFAVEENRTAVDDGEVSRRLNRIDEERCRFTAQPVEMALKRVKAAGTIVMDPPRDGLSPIVLEELRRLAPALIVYVSCNPEALARDLAVLVRDGMQVRSIQPVDMFPHTAHVETVVTLSRGAEPRR